VQQQWTHHNGVATRPGTFNTSTIDVCRRLTTGNNTQSPIAGIAGVDTHSHSEHGCEQVPWRLRMRDALFLTPITPARVIEGLIKRDMQVAMQVHSPVRIGVLIKIRTQHRLRRKIQETPFQQSMPNNVPEQTTPLAVKQPAVARAIARERFELVIHMLNLIDVE